MVRKSIEFIYKLLQTSAEACICEARSMHNLYEDAKVEGTICAGIPDVLHPIWLEETICPGISDPLHLIC